MGKWGKIIGGIGGLVAAPFTGGATLGLGASLLGSGLSQGSAGSNQIDPNSPQGQLLALQQKGVQQGQATAGELTPIAKNFLTTAQQGFQQPTDYWSSILSGNRQAATSALAPQIQQIQQSGQKAGEAAQWLSPRSGTTASGREMSIYAPQQATSALLQTLRPQAATNLVDIASRQGALGTGVAGAASSFLRGAGDTGNSALNYLQRQNQLQFEQSRAMGSSIWDLFKNMGGKLGGLFNGGGGGANYSGVTSDQSGFWNSGGVGPV